MIARRQGECRSCQGSHGPCKSLVSGMSVLCDCLESKLDVGGRAWAACLTAVWLEFVHSSAWLDQATGAHTRSLRIPTWLLISDSVLVKQQWTIPIQDARQMQRRASTCWAIQHELTPTKSAATLRKGGTLLRLLLIHMCPSHIWFASLEKEVATLF